MRLLLSSVIAVSSLSVWALSVWALADNKFTAEHTFADIQHIDINAFGTLEVQHGQHNALKVTADSDISEYLNVSEQNGKLQIVDTRPDSLWFKTSQAWKRLTGNHDEQPKVHYHLTVVDPQSLTINGYFSAKVRALKNHELTLVFNGSGQLHLQRLQQKHLFLNANGNIDTLIKNVEAENADMKINGRGELQFKNTNILNLQLTLNGMHNCQLQGQSRHFSFKMEGYGECHGSNFIAENADLDLRGDSQVVLDIRQHMQARTLDQSRIEYFGNPTIVNTDTSELNVLQLAEYQSKMYF